MKWLNPGIWLAVLLAIAAAGGAGYWRGAKDVRAEWQTEKLQAEQQAEQNRLLRQSAVNKTAKIYAEKSAKSRETAQSNLAKVDRYAPTDFPPLPGAFRVWHDAAAAGEALDDQPGLDAYAVSLKEVETTIAYNYADCRDDKERLKSLQEIIHVLNGEADEDVSQVPRE
jgi:hypothetical protein